MTAISIRITAILAGVTLIRVTDKNAQTQLTREIAHLGILRFDDETTYINVNTHWQKISRVDLLKVIRNLIDSEDRYEVSSGIIAEVAKRLAENADLQFNIEAAKRAQEYLINFKNGVLNILTGEFNTDRSKWIFDYVLDVEYLEQCTKNDCPSFLNFIKTSAGIENLQCILISLGYGISSLINVKKAVFLIGETDGGKSTLLDFLSGVVAPELVSNINFQQLSNGYFVIQLLGKKLNISYDNSSKAMDNEQMFKSIVACERISARALRENPIQFVPTAKLFFASNKPYTYKNPDLALYRRMVFIPFEYSVPPEKQDKELLTKLEKERNVVFSLAARTLKGFVESGYDFKMSPKGKAYLESRIAALHSVDSFLDDRTVIDENGSISAASLFEAYKLWCNENALDADEKAEFKESVLAFNPNIEFKKVGPRQKRVWGFKGIRLKTADELNAPNSNEDEK
ncbi:phage/plasmid primase, P4 family, C-terminal domain-containing protein [Ruminococcus flavefaciens]|uniref:Phage/plasmid primase, P4 family, C-terminal domain-containing protein n=1 Tax=Ruminococcus flavefaciens TaxID=1265 RepID=A0A1H6IKL2_RUMFL|nr:phage/plasmid primase, P4 family [Ruminococcus flavefaciens]SEH48491.1 phage/plasmid primase, P4 family, C-terminal domain-containing protein [Ruminococcus flavefaciens]